MNDAEEFELLKKDLVNTYSAYLKDIEEFSFNDITNISQNMKLIQFYTASVHANISYRRFINKLRFK